MTPDQDRRAMLAKVHIARKELLLSEETYRDIVLRVSGGKSDSAGKLNYGQLNDLLSEFKRLGWSRRTPPKTATRDPQSQKIRALWIALADAGVVRDRGEASLRGYVHRMTNRSDLRFCSGAERSRVIEALKQWAARTGVAVE